MPTKVCIVKTMVFPVVIYGCESWTIKKAECQRTDAFKLWCWRRLWRVPWTAERSNKSILKEINTEYSLEGLMLKLKLQYFGHLMQRAKLLEKNLMLGKIEGRRRRGKEDKMGWVTSLTHWTWVWASSRSWWRTGKLGVLQSMGSQRVGCDWATEQQQQHSTESRCFQSPKIHSSNNTQSFKSYIMFLFCLKCFPLLKAKSNLNKVPTYAFMNKASISLTFSHFTLPLSVFQQHWLDISQALQFTLVLLASWILLLQNIMWLVLSLIQILLNIYLL